MPTYGTPVGRQPFAAVILMQQRKTTLTSTGRPLPPGLRPKAWGRSGGVGSWLLLRIDFDLRHRLVIVGVEGGQVGLGGAELLQQLARGLQAPVVGVGRAVAPGEAVGAGGGLDGGRVVAGSRSILASKLRASAWNRG